MAILSARFVTRFDRLSTAYRDRFASRVDLVVRDHFREYMAVKDFMPVDEPGKWAWCRADLFLAGFPKVRVRPGIDIVCYFSVDPNNRNSSLLAYHQDAAPMVEDPLEKAMLMAEAMKQSNDSSSAPPTRFHGCLIPEMPPGWETHDTRVHPAWIETDLLRVVHDDGTPEGLFEKAQLLLWSGEPINLWHAVGYGHHRIEVYPPERGRFPGLSLPEVWLPLAERNRAASEIDGVEVEGDSWRRVEGQPCDVVQFWTSSSFGIEAFYRHTLLMTDDAWHHSTQCFPTGESGYIV